MKIISQTTLATAVTLALLGSTVQASPVGYAGKLPLKVDYSDSFNTQNRVDTRVDNSRRLNSDTRLNYDLDNSVRTRIDRDTRLDLRYDYRQDNLNAGQRLNQLRSYGSSVGQNAANVGGASGHSMNQSQGDTSVGSLVSESSTAHSRGHSLLSPRVSVQYGATEKGNLYSSQIGGNQSGLQGGNVTNLQTNDQQQDAASYTGSVDWVGNQVAK